MPDNQTTAEDEPAALDYRALLAKYMEHVAEEEGATFVPQMEWREEFTEEECRELQAIERECFPGGERNAT